jgi:hypothetical protein
MDDANIDQWEEDNRATPRVDNSSNNTCRRSTRQRRLPSRFQDYYMDN